MASITIRNLDEALKRRLRIQAARHGYSMEEEVRVILRRALTSPGQRIGSSIHARFAELGGFEMTPPSREPMRPPVDFE